MFIFAVKLGHLLDIYGVFVSVLLMIVCRLDFKVLKWEIQCCV